MLQLISIVLLAALLTAILVKGSEVPSSQEEKNHILQKLDQLKAGLDHLCRPCPWDWTLFQGNCYFFSTFLKTWKESVTACEDMGAQLVIIKSDEEQVY
ncbi:CD209 antigen-like protein A [Arvicanthis niloticus]|uniref:CD209 antigen-like protein A n=1 Tax=Arvicanthis niloticus TaxID=61156 RepID=UPI00403D001B